MLAMDNSPLRQRLERYNRPTVRRAAATAVVSGAALAGLYYLMRSRRRQQEQWVDVPMGEVVETVIIQPL
jgi:hypothetical protein